MDCKAYDSGMKLLGQARAKIRTLHHAYRAEQTYYSE